MAFLNFFRPAFSADQLSEHPIAYFSMEIALHPAMPTYSGGLGVLAGDTLRSAADLSLPVIAVTLLHRQGYFRQRLEKGGIQREEPQPWNPEDFLVEESVRVRIPLDGHDVLVRAWRYEIQGITGHVVPVYLLDTDLEENSEADRTLTGRLYGGDTEYRLRQEAVLGIAGAQILQALGISPEVYHLNEGHAALLALSLLEQQIENQDLSLAGEAEAQLVREKCVFTTHTPVPAGHDCFSADQVYRILGPARAALLERLGCCRNGLLNVTHIALRFSRFVNGVAMQHGKVSRELFPGYDITAITNGVHAGTWTSPALAALYDRELSNWRFDNQQLRYAINLPLQAVAAAHQQAKSTLFSEVAARTGIRLDPRKLTLGFARRAAAYKRADLLFTDPHRLIGIAQQAGGLQILYGGKAHPADDPGKELIRRVVEMARVLRSDLLQIVYLENYEWELGALLTSGVDVWLNTPRRPHEASGTSGMKAALNGVPSLSVLDGWWIEGCLEGVTGWAVDDGDTDAGEAENLYQKLEEKVVPLYHRPEQWAQLSRQTIAQNGAFFNTHRMLEQYVRNAYYPERLMDYSAEALERVLA